MDVDAIVASWRCLGHLSHRDYYTRPLDGEQTRLHTDQLARHTLCLCHGRYHLVFQHLRGESTTSDSEPFTHSPHLHLPRHYYYLMGHIAASIGKRCLHPIHQ